MKYDVIVVGAGLAGLFAGALAAQRGAKTLVIARGVGSTHVRTGCVDVLGYDATGNRLASPVAEMPKFIEAKRAHPYALAGLDALNGGLRALKAMCESAGYVLGGELAENYWLPTAAGSIRCTCIAPQSFIAGDVRRTEPIALAALTGFRDYYARLAADNLGNAVPGLRVEAHDVSLPDRPAHREAYASDLARLFDDANYRAKVARAWKTELGDKARVGFPAVLGLAHGPTAHRDLADRLGADVFEIPILPPSIPGIRLYNALVETLKIARGNLIVGPEVTGRVDGRAVPRPRVNGIVAHAAGRWRDYEAGAVVLATGGFLGGGLVAERAGVVAESVFDLPVTYSDDAESWFTSRVFGNHPYARFGVRVDGAMRVLDANGEVMYDNLYAIGSVLAGADRLAEGSREGIDVATAWKALQSW